MKKNLVLQLVLFAAAVCTLSGCVKLDTKKTSTTSANALNWTQSSLSTQNVYQFAVSGTTVYAATSSGLYSSTNAGTTWTAVAGGLPASVEASNVAVNGSNIYVGTASGIYFSTDNGTSWTATTSSTVTLVLSLAASGSNLFAGSIASGVYLSTDNGTSWTAVNSGLPTNANVVSLFVNGSNLFAGVDVVNGAGGAVGTDIYLSTNNGTSWAAIGTGLPQVANVYSFAVSGSTLYAGIVGYTSADVASGSGIYTSTNNGSSWTAVAAGGLPTFQLYNVEALAVSGSNLFAGLDFVGVYRSTDNGSTWTSVGNTLTSSTTARCIVIVGNTIMMGDDLTSHGVFTATF